MSQQKSDLIKRISARTGLSPDCIRRRILAGTNPERPKQSKSLVSGPFSKTDYERKLNAMAIGHLPCALHSIVIANKFKGSNPGSWLRGKYRQHFDRQFDLEIMQCQ